MDRYSGGIMPVAKTKKKLGAPSKYLPSMCKIAEEAAGQGLINPEIAAKLGITRETLNVWMHEKPDFSDAVKRGKEIADARVERSLYELAMGYEYDAERPMTVGTGKGFSEIEIAKFREKLPPNATAIIFWLKNRKPKEWRDKQEIGLTDSEGNDRNFTLDFVTASKKKK